MGTIQDTRTPDQVRRDRWAALAVVVGFAILIGLMVYAVLTGEQPTMPVDDWFLMP